MLKINTLTGTKFAEIICFMLGPFELLNESSIEQFLTLEKETTCPSHKLFLYPVVHIVKV